MVPKKQERYGRLVIDATMKKKSLGKRWRESPNTCILSYRYSYKFPSVQEISLQSHAAAPEASKTGHKAGISSTDINDNFHQVPCHLDSVHLLAIVIGNNVFFIPFRPADLIDTGFYANLLSRILHINLTTLYSSHFTLIPSDPLIFTRCEFPRPISKIRLCGNYADDNYAIDHKTIKRGEFQQKCIQRLLNICGLPWRWKKVEHYFYLDIIIGWVWNYYKNGILPS